MSLASLRDGTPVCERFWIRSKSQRHVYGKVEKGAGGCQLKGFLLLGDGTGGGSPTRLVRRSFSRLKNDYNCCNDELCNRLHPEANLRPQEVATSCQNPKTPSTVPLSRLPSPFPASFPLPSLSLLIQYIDQNQITMSEANDGMFTSTLRLRRHRRSHSVS